MRNSLPALQFCGFEGGGGLQEEETVGANAQRQELCAGNCKSLEIHNRGSWRVITNTSGRGRHYMCVLFIIIHKTLTFMCSTLFHMCYMMFYIYAG